ncbi:unnamed protein product [Fusarium graminearum]|nr:unnamed protein product [Fusarium graminearum]VTO85645.1 unnamed protein product [Fusarium graminearum]
MDYGDERVAFPYLDGPNASVTSSKGLSQPCHQNMLAYVFLESCYDSHVDPRQNFRTEAYKNKNFAAG